MRRCTPGRPDLDDDSLNAARDEVAHARLCFSMASANSGRPTEAGPVDRTSIATAAVGRVSFAEAPSQGWLGDEEANASSGMEWRGI